MLLRIITSRGNKCHKCGETGVERWKLEDGRHGEHEPPQEAGFRGVPFHLSAWHRVFSRNLLSLSCLERFIPV